MKHSLQLHNLKYARYGTNHMKLNVLQAYLFCENACETDMGMGVPVLLFTLYSNQHLMLHMY